MSTVNTSEIGVSRELVDAVESFPIIREVNHCGETFSVSPFDLSAKCPTCNARIKLRAFSANLELEDLFDAFLGWLANPEAAKIAAERQKQLKED